MVSRTRPRAESGRREIGFPEHLRDSHLAIVHWTGLARVATLQIQAPTLRAGGLAILQAFEPLPDPLPALLGRSLANREQLKLSRGVRHGPSVPQVFRIQR